MKDYSDGVAIVALCPALGESSNGDPAHCTIVYCGTTDDVSLQEAIKIDSLTRVMAIMQLRSFTAPVVGEAMFGENNDEPVLTLPEDHATLTFMRSRCQYLSRSTFTRYRPHVSTRENVDSVTFTALALWYGTKRITYPFLMEEETDGFGND